MVALAHERLCRALTREGALVRIIALPRLEGHEKTGADDFLVAQGRHAFETLVNAARPWEPYTWLIDLIPEDLPASALVAALEPLRRRLIGASRPEKIEFIHRLCEVQPGLSRSQAMSVVLGETAPPDGTVPADLPPINVKDRQVLEMVGDAWAALVASTFGPRLFRFGQNLVLIPDTGASKAGQASLHQVDHSLMSAMLNRSASWVCEGKDGARDTRLPLEVVRDMIALPDPTLRVLDALVHVPVVRGDGSLVAGAGYDPASRLYHVADEKVAAVAAQMGAGPSAERRGNALAMLTDDLLGDFPFARASDRAHALAAILLPVVRHMIDGPSPLHVVEAPSEGTGKSLLADAVSTVTTGASAQPMTLPTAEEEVRKKITATLLAAPAVVLLDNVGHVLDSASIAAVLTCESWSDRMLGQSRMVTLPNRALWIATANNPTLSRENARRSVRIRLDADVERPWLREGFRHPDLRAWVHQARPEIVAALLVLVQGWIADGRPPGSVSLGSFERWSQVLGGILEAAGVRGFLGDRYEEQGTVDSVEAEWRGFVDLWSECIGTRWVAAGELLALAGERRLLNLDQRHGPPPARRVRVRTQASSRPQVRGVPNHGQAGRSPEAARVLAPGKGTVSARTPLIGGGRASTRKHPRAHARLSLGQA